MCNLCCLHRNTIAAFVVAMNLTQGASDITTVTSTYHMARAEDCQPGMGRLGKLQKEMSVSECRTSFRRQTGNDY